MKYIYKENPLLKIFLFILFLTSRLISSPLLDVLGFFDLVRKKAVTTSEL